MKKISLCFICICLLTLSGCISSSVKGFTDPEYVGFKPKKILLYMPDGFGEAFKQNLIQTTNVESVTYGELFLPTRTYTDDKKAEIIVHNNIDTIMALDVTGDNVSSQITSYQTSSNATAYSYGNSAQASGTSTTVPVTTKSRSSSAKITLMKSGGGVVWVGTINTSAKGGFYTDSASTMNSMARETINELINKGHLDRKK